MTRHSHLVLFSAGLALCMSPEPSPAQTARKPESSPQLTRCMATTGSMDSKIAACEFEEYRRLDVRLNQVYRDLIVRMGSERKDSLRASQRAWVAFRDAECAYRRSLEEGGTIAPVMEAGCLMDLTGKRVDELTIDSKYAR